MHARSLADADAAYADEVLAAAAPAQRPDQLAKKAAALETRLAPDAVRARKDRAKRLDQRVEANHRRRLAAACRGNQRTRSG